MILPTYPGKIPQDFPFHPHKERFSQTELFVKGPFGIFQGAHVGTLPKTNQNASENRPSEKETIVFQPSIFRCELLVSGRVYLMLAQLKF